MFGIFIPTEDTGNTAGAPQILTVTEVLVPQHEIPRHLKGLPACRPDFTSKRHLPSIVLRDPMKAIFLTELQAC